MEISLNSHKGDKGGTFTCSIWCLQCSFCVTLDFIVNLMQEIPKNTAVKILWAPPLPLHYLSLTASPLPHRHGKTGPVVVHSPDGCPRRPRSSNFRLHVNCARKTIASRNSRSSGIFVISRPGANPLGGSDSLKLRWNQLSLVYISILIILAAQTNAIFSVLFYYNVNFVIFAKSMISN